MKESGVRLLYLFKRQSSRKTVATLRLLPAALRTVNSCNRIGGVEDNSGIVSDLQLATVFLSH